MTLRAPGVAAVAAVSAAWVAISLAGGPGLAAQLTVAGLVLGAVYALAGLGLVVTYRASGVVNIGHGAIAMVVAYVFWQLDAWGLPLVVAASLAVLVAGPAIGVLVERLVFRPLHRRGAGPTELLVASVGLFVLLVAVAALLWGFETRTDPPSLFPTRSLALPGGAHVGIDQLGILVLVGVVAAALARFLNRTRPGLRIRAVVESRDEAELAGVDTGRVSALGWALGAGLAGVSGVLLAPATFGLNPYSLTLLVTESFAVAVLARLTSLRVTVLAGLGLGLAVSFATQVRLAPLRAAGLPADLVAGLETFVRPLLSSLPVVVLFAALLLQRRGSLVPSRPLRLPAEPASSPEQRLVRGVLGLGLATALVLAPFVLAPAALRPLHDMLGLAVVLLSIVAVTGLGGVISLGQAAFVGVGAVLLGRLVAGTLGLPPLPPLLAVLLAALATGLLGLAVGYPALRRSGVLLALSTFAAAILLERLLFANYGVTAGLLELRRPEVLGVDLAPPDRFHYLLLAGLAVAVVVTRALGAGRTGRTIRALRDAPAAARSLGIRPLRTSLGLFAVSAALAGFGGCLMALTAQTFEPAVFGTTQSLIWFAAVVVAGAGSVPGALLAAFALAVLPAVLGDGGVVTMLVGLGALALARFPGGLVAALRSGPVAPAAAAPPVPQARLAPTPLARRLLSPDDVDA